MEAGKGLKPLFWIGSTRNDLKAFPRDVRQVLGFALYMAQGGSKHPDAKPLKGFGGAGVLEIVENSGGGAFRAVYTVKLKAAVYALHAFQKKSKKGTATPRHELSLIRERLERAREHHAEWASRNKE